MNSSICPHCLYHFGGSSWMMSGYLTTDLWGLFSNSSELGIIVLFLGVHYMIVVFIPISSIYSHLALLLIFLHLFSSAPFLYSPSTFSAHQPSPQSHLPKSNSHQYHYFCQHQPHSYPSPSSWIFSAPPLSLWPTDSPLKFPKDEWAVHTISKYRDFEIQPNFCGWPWCNNWSWLVVWDRMMNDWLSSFFYF